MMTCPFSLCNWEKVPSSQHESMKSLSSGHDGGDTPSLPWAPTEPQTQCREQLSEDQAGQLGRKCERAVPSADCAPVISPPALPGRDSRRPEAQKWASAWAELQHKSSSAPRCEEGVPWPGPCRQCRFTTPELPA